MELLTLISVLLLTCFVSVDVSDGQGTDESPMDSGPYGSEDLQSNEPPPGSIETYQNRGICFPNKTFMKNICWRCMCNSDGTDYKCSKAQPQNKTEPTIDRNREPEEPLQCVGDGHYRVPLRCDPDTTFLMGCTPCRCDKEGTSATCKSEDCEKPGNIGETVFWEWRHALGTRRDLLNSTLDVNVSLH